MARRKWGFPTSPPGPTLATRKRARRAAAALAAALIAAPTGAAAKSGCELIEVMLAKDAARLRGVGIVVNAKGLLDTTLDGKPSALRDASHCDLVSPQDEFDLDCDWDYPAGEDEAAERDFAQMVGRLAACLPAPLELVGPVTDSEAELAELGAKHGPSFVEYLRAYEKRDEVKASYLIDEDAEVSLRVRLVLDRDDRTGRLQISASFKRY